jgi:hypothetical protein
VGVNLSKVTKNKEKMSFGFKHDLFSFALMVIFSFQLFLSVFQKWGKSKIIVLHLLFTLLEVGYMPLDLQPLRHGKYA